MCGGGAGGGGGGGWSKAATSAAAASAAAAAAAAVAVSEAHVAASGRADDAARRGRIVARRLALLARRAPLVAAALDVSARLLSVAADVALSARVAHAAGGALQLADLLARRAGPACDADRPRDRAARRAHDAACDGPARRPAALFRRADGAAADGHSPDGAANQRDGRLRGQLLAGRDPPLLLAARPRLAVVAASPGGRSDGPAGQWQLRAVRAVGSWGGG
mmetsp:Transcript_5011/g.16040  ORF Transcript_5011/g.16040 Transcript_5011/m.16040 type:complete len:222 (-) Transcript_5011:385-1050(-)